MIGSIISAIVVGTIIGVIGRLLVKGRQRISVIVTILIGIVAAFLGTLIANLLGVGDTSGFDWIEFIIQVVLAAVGVSLVAGRGGRIR
jgi:uncharacterized membrane protein YeaQ/YmgE (transglycosylase-associated protein family)